MVKFPSIKFLENQNTQNTTNVVPTIDPIFADTLCGSKTLTENPASDFVTVDVAGGVSITEYVCSSKDVVIPCEINGKPVVAIGNATAETGTNSSFKNRQLTSVVFPNTLIEIGYLSFMKNQLTDLVIPNSVMHINDSAFHDNLLVNVKLSESVKQIGQSTFQNNKFTTFEIPEGVTEIRFAAFSFNGLTEIRLPSSLTTTQESIFSSNPNLTKVQNCSSLNVENLFSSSPSITSAGC